MEGFSWIGDWRRVARSVLHFNETTDFDLYLHYDVFNTTTTEVLIPVYLHISCEESMVIS